MIKIWNINKWVKCLSFGSEAKGSEEFFLSVTTEANISFKDSLKMIFKNYKGVLKECGLSSDSQIFCRYYLSDIANQKAELEQSEIFNFTRGGAYSVIQQCPLNSGSIVLFIYHIKKKNEFIAKEIMNFDDELWRNGVKIKGSHYELFWVANFSGYGELDSFEQTKEIFSTFNDTLNANGMTLLHNTIRTWVYVRDIDNNYQGMIDSRKDYFYEQGLTKETRYIASTGIEAKLKETRSLVSLDALSIANLDKRQIVRMEARGSLCPTDDYGVTFERGTKIVFGDRAHLYISGTASIDKAGCVLYPSDVKKQTKRVLENIRALLKPYGAGLADLAYLVVYLRNITETKKVNAVLKEYFPEKIPLIIVEGAVCRSNWLVEMEGVAVIKESSLFPPFL